ncbi:MAG: hypothetical protein U9Q40_03165 [Campylobacterota bacterium]|nr:hypothetical protein [Campylobacterota bacterium]
MFKERITRQMLITVDIEVAHSKHNRNFTEEELNEIISDNYFNSDILGCIAEVGSYRIHEKDRQFIKE